MEHLLERHPLRGVAVQQRGGGDQRHKHGRVAARGERLGGGAAGLVVGRDRAKVGGQHPRLEVLHLLGDKRATQREELEADDTKRPHVGRVAVWLPDELLGRHVVRRADKGRRELLGRGHLEGEPKVGDLAAQVGGEQHVLGRQVAVQHAHGVDVAQRAYHLAQPRVHA
eukprot:scaffold22013_cov32-Phaeocystis_antarctica.AAC.2